MNPRDERALLIGATGGEARSELRVWAMNALAHAIGKIADEVSEDTGASRFLLRLWLASEMRDQVRRQMEWYAGEARAEGQTLGTIGLATGMQPNNIRKNFPALEEIVTARRRAQETGEPQTVTVQGQAVILDPIPETR